MPTVVASRTIGASPQAVWEVVGDPHHLPRWWPRVTRVEGVALTAAGEPEAFTEVLIGRKGKVVRADFEVLETSPEQCVVWAQQVQGTPFEGVLRSAVTQIDLSPAQVGADVSAGTEVRIALRQELPGPLGGGRGGRGGDVGRGGRVGDGGGGLPSGRAFGLARFGSPLVKRAAARTVEQALEGLMRVFGDGD
jgi:uncharacterized protein YndB with AHSA1/START domain